MPTTVHGANPYDLMSNGQLLYIVHECSNLDELKAKCYGPPLRNHIFKALLSSQPSLPLHSSSSTMNRVMSALEESSKPLLLCWIMISFFSLGAVSLVMMGSFALMGLAVFFSGLYFYQDHHHVRLERRKANIQLAIIKTQALDVLLKRRKLVINNCPKIINFKKISCSKKKSFLFGFTIADLIFCTLYWATTDMMAGLGLASLASFLTGPVGFVIAVCVAIGIGAWCAVEYYQLQKSHRIVSTIEKTIHSQNEKKKFLLFILPENKEKNFISSIQLLQRNTQDQKTLSIEEKKSDNNTSQYDKKNTPCSLKRSKSQLLFAFKFSLPYVLQDEKQVRNRREVSACTSVIPTNV